MSKEHEYWQTRDYGGEGKAINLSKQSLGNFFYWLYKFQGEVTSAYIMNAEFERCYCQFAVKLPKNKKSEFETLSGLSLEPVVTLTPPR